MSTIRFSNEYSYTKVLFTLCDYYLSKFYLFWEVEESTSRKEGEKCSVERGHEVKQKKVEELAAVRVQENKYEKVR